jgi:hypothetical protein
MGRAPHLNQLFVKYRFLDMLHEAEFNDEDQVAMPLEEHCIQTDGTAEETEGDDVAGEHAHTSLGSHSTSHSPSKAHRVSAAAHSTVAHSSASTPSAMSSRSLRAQKARRRRTLMFVGGAVVIGSAAALLRYRGVTAADAAAWLAQMRDFIARGAVNMQQRAFRAVGLQSTGPSAPRTKLTVGTVPPPQSAAVLGLAQ